MKALIWLSLSIISFSCFAWEEDLRKEIKKIDENFEGDIGLVIKDLRTGKKLEYNADEKWYLSSTMKVIVALSLMEEVEKGRIHLTQKVTLKEKNFVDGGGPLMWTEPGKQFSVGYLLKVMLRESDNTAADLLIGLIGPDELNRDFKKFLPGAGTATSLLEVRYLSYSELHPRARSLSNMDFVQLKNLPLEKRHIAFAEKIKVPITSLKYKNLEDAQEKYYTHGYNTAPLKSYVELLEKLEEGELLSKTNTQLLLTHMKEMKTGDHRIKAGLPSGLVFMQKTGTQINRACNVGLIRRESASKSDIALAVCVKKESESVSSNEVFKKIGERLFKSTTGPFTSSKSFR